MHGTVYRGRFEGGAREGVGMEVKGAGEMVIAAGESRKNAMSLASLSPMVNHLTLQP